MRNADADKLVSDLRHEADLFAGTVVEQVLRRAADWIEAHTLPVQRIEIPEPKRYAIWCAATHGHDVIEHKAGPLVKASDYDALLKVAQGLEEQLKVARATKRD